MNQRYNSPLLLSIVLIFSLQLMFAHSGDKKKNGAQADDKEICLEVTGNLDASAKNKEGSYTVKLIQNNKVLEQVKLNANEKFKLSLKRNSAYTIRIEKEGYIPRLVSVNTALPENTRQANLYRFHFDMQLFSESFARYFDSDDIDFPIALIAYDKTKGVFHYDKNYTSRIQQKMHNMSSLARKE